jgi:hypothetical protein
MDDDLDRQRMTSRWAVALYVVLAVAPFAYAALDREFWESVAPIASLLWFVLVAAVVARRHWAWLLALLIEVAILVTWPFSDDVPWYAVVLNVLSLAVLASPPMRRYVTARA